MSLPLTGTGRSVWSVQFYQENDGIAFGSGASIDNLFAADCTIEYYLLVPGIGAGRYPLSKSDGGATVGWRTFTTGVGAIAFDAQFATNDLSLVSTTVTDVGRWYHVAMDWDVGTLTGRLFVGGELEATDAAVGVYQSGAAQNLICNGIVAVGSVDASMSIGWIRFSNSRRYVGASFEPPPRNAYPANDASAQLLVYMNDGAGATVTDYSGNGNDGTITFGANTRWYNDPV